jgi:predicted  nucleic acid-binding Zn-ribbon protein
MPEYTEPENPIATPEEEKPRKKLDEEEDMMEENIERMYKAIGELTEAVKTIATGIKSVEDTNRGLLEAVKGEISTLREEFKKFMAGFSEATSAHKEQDKYPTSEGFEGERCRDVGEKQDGVCEECYGSAAFWSC